MEKAYKRLTEKWSELEESLIAQVREQPILYRCDAKSYKHTVIKEKKWREIATSLNLTRGDCKIKWKGIRDGYRRNRLLELQGKSNRKSKYSDERLDFLRVTVPNPKDRYSAVKVEEDNEEAMQEDPQPEATFQEINEHFLEQSNNFVNEKDVLLEELRRGREERYELMRLMGSITMANQCETPVHSFFKSMADVVSLFPASKIADVRMRVCKIVSDTEIDCLRKCDTSDKSDSRKTADSTAEDKTEFIRPEIQLIEQND